MAQGFCEFVDVRVEDIKLHDALDTPFGLVHVSSVTVEPSGRVSLRLRRHCYFDRSSLVRLAPVPGELTVGSVPAEEVVPGDLLETLVGVFPVDDVAPWVSDRVILTVGVERNFDPLSVLQLIVYDASDPRLVSAVGVGGGR